MVGLIFFVSVFLLELITNKKWVTETGHNYRIDLSYVALKRIVIVVVAGLLNDIFNWFKVTLPWHDYIRSSPVVVQAILLLFLNDLIFYFAHRAFHQSSWLWPLHHAHHATPYFSVLAGARMHPLYIPFTVAISIFCFKLLGTSYELAALSIAAYGMITTFSHAKLPWRFGPLRFLVVSPMFHEWHHSDEVKSRNLALVFSFIDLIFGTYYLPKHSPPTIGVANNPVADAFLPQLAFPFYEWRRLLSFESLKSASSQHTPAIQKTAIKQSDL